MKLGFYFVDGDKLIAAKSTKRTQMFMTTENPARINCIERLALNRLDPRALNSKIATLLRGSWDKS